MPDNPALTSSHVGRVLIVRTDRLGDVILTLPMLPCLRKRYPDAHLEMLLQRYTGEIVRGNPYLDGMLWYDTEGTRRSFPFGVMLRQIRSRKFDAVVLVHPTLRLALLMILARIPVRVGSGYRYYSFLFNRRVYEHRKDALRHEVEYNLGLLRELDCTPGADVDFSVRISRDDQESVDRLLRSHHIQPGEELVILHPGSGGSAREWPARHFATLAGLLWKERHSRIVITGLPADESKARMLVEATDGNSLSLVGKLSIKELAALLRSADLVVANSTGPLHIAVAVGTPVVALYPQLTPMSAARWGPYTAKKRVFEPDRPVDCRDCSPATGQECACMASIPVADVYHAATELLAEPRDENVHSEAHEG